MNTVFAGLGPKVILDSRLRGIAVSVSLWAAGHAV